MENSPIDKNNIVDTLLLGIIYFVIIPLILTIIYLIPDSVKEVMLLYTGSPTFISIIGSNYLHFTFVHFISNIVFYFLTVSFVFVFDALVNRRMLLINLFLLFIALPVVVSVVNIVVFSFIGVDAASNGFSAIVAGLFGYLAFSTLNFIRKFYGVGFKRGVFQLMWFILYVNLLIISLVYGYFILVVVLVVLVVLSAYYNLVDLRKLFSLFSRLKISAFIFLFTSLFLCLFVGVIGLFPQSIGNRDDIVNILAHYLGYIFGFVVPAVVSMYLVDKRKK